MKSVMTLVLGMAIAGSVFAAAKPVSLRMIEDEARDAGSVYIGDGQDCSLEVQEIRGGIRIVMKSEEATAWLIVKDDSKITLKSREDSDGSYSHEYTVKGQGTLSFVNSDDAYFHAYLNAGGKEVACEIDF